MMDHAVQGTIHRVVIRLYIVFYQLLETFAFQVVFYDLILTIAFHLCLDLNTQEIFEIYIGYIWTIYISSHAGS